MTSILKGYREFLLPITRAPTVGTTDTSSLFDLPGTETLLPPEVDISQKFLVFFFQVRKTQI